mgnify:CR=1 FL=1
MACRSQVKPAHHGAAALAACLASSADAGNAAARRAGLCWHPPAGLDRRQDGLGAAAGHAAAHVGVAGRAACNGRQGWEELIHPSGCTAEWALV